MKKLRTLSIAVALNSACVAHLPASAPVVTEDDWIRLDRSMPSSVPTCNRTAFDVLWLRQKVDERAHKISLLDCSERAALAENRAERRLEELQHASWWARWGFPLVVVGFLIGGIGGGFTVYELSRTHATP